MPTNHRPQLFRALLASLMQERGVTQVQLATRSGIVVSRLNNYLHGKYRTIGLAHLEATCNALGETPAETASVIQACLYDLLPEGLRGPIDIRVHGAKDPGKWEPPSKGLPATFARQFADLYRLCISRPLCGSGPRIGCRSCERAHADQPRRRPTRTGLLDRLALR